MATRVQVTFDCKDTTVLEAFWATALHYVSPPPPPGFATRLRVQHESAQHYGITMQDPEGNEFCLH
jgi:hypothetical protein